MSSSAFELETNEGEILTFSTEADRAEYVLSRLVEQGELVPVGRDAAGEIILRLKGTEHGARE